MPEEHHLTARNLLEQMNRQFNECNALYHELAVHYGVSDTVFWLLYTLYNSSEPQTQNRLCMEWNLPKQTMNSAVASMVRQGLLELTTLGMKLYSLSFLLCGFNIFGSAFFTALNNGIVSAVISFLRTLVFQVTAILVLPHLLGMNGIWLSVVAAEIAALFVNAFFLVKNRKKYQY